ncbi:hypothetical protein JHD46_07740, partial [Sulfurimonas sp. SAG-AH-194-C20]
VGNDTNYTNPFELVFGGSDLIIYGDYASISSSVECVDDGNGDCDDSYSGYLFNATTIYKNDDATISLNSSTETLTLPADINGSDILFAGLYWQGNITGDDELHYNTTFSNTNENGGIIGRDEVTFVDSLGASHTINADKVWYHDFWGNGTGRAGGHRSFYQSYTDITTILQNSYRSDIINDYTVGNIKASAGADYPTYFWAENGVDFNGVKIGFWGNWQLIVVYNHSNIQVLTPQPKPKNIAIFHGFQPLIPLQSNSSKSIDINVTGFLTPKQSPINAKMLFYGSGGEKQLAYDVLEIQDKKTTNFIKISNSANPIDGAFNGSISSFGTPIDPTISYYPGLDSDEFNVSVAMDTTQSTTVLRLTAENVNGTGDQFLPGLIAFSTDVFEPSFCYDYAYKQLSRFFTEDNDGQQNPRIVGPVEEGEPITVSIYLRNLVDSDVAVADMNLTVSDINTSQATYIRNSTYLALNTSLQTAVSDADIITNGGTVSDSFINGIPIGDLSTNDYFYTYYDINTTTGTQDINMSLNVNAAYTLQTSTVSIPYNLNLSSDIPMCTTSTYNYSSEVGAFNIVHGKYYDYDTNVPTKRYYNLPSQITNRVGNFKVISIDENDTLTTRSAIVAVETIDAAAFHSALVSCQELGSSISEKVWMIFDDVNSVLFDKSALDTAYSEGRTTLNPSSDLYKNARENSAFRTSYPVDSNGSLQLLQEIVQDTTWKITNFTYDQTQTCVNGGGTIGSACGDDGSGNSSEMTKAELSTCMECIYGISTKLTCSRDNFSIRPDAFSLTLSDSNQTQSPKQTIVTNLTPTPNTVNLAAGYIYNLEINATNFLNTISSDGYTKLYSTFNDKDFLEYLWSPDTTLLGCNDDANVSLSLRIANGGIDFNLPSFIQVGRYKLYILDTSWTIVDNDINNMTHHYQTYPNGDDMFYMTNDGEIIEDCILNSSITQTEASSELNGCNVSSDHNNTNGTISTDIFTVFHPYKFDVTNITPSIGLDNDTNVNDSFIYMSDLSQDENMSFHLNGTISALGFDDVALSNFVDQCYAKNISLDINKSTIANLSVAYAYKLNTYDSNGTEIRTISQDLNNTNNTVNLLTTDFPSTLNGSASTILNLNFTRRKDTAVNPQEITFTQYDVNCTTSSECTFNADLSASKKSEGNLNLNNTTIKHYYGRTSAPRQIFESNNATAFIYYEAYCSGTDIGGQVCAKALLADGSDSNSTDDPRWFKNTLHDSNTYGNVGTVKQRSGTGAATDIVDVTNLADTNPEQASVSYDESLGYPYKTTMDNNASSWLIYDRYDNSTNTNKFEIEFTGTGGSWSGKDNAQSTVNTSTSLKTNRRSMW